MPIYGYGASVALFVFLAFHGSGAIRTTGKISCDAKSLYDIFPVFYFHLFADYGLGTYKKQKGGTHNERSKTLCRQFWRSIF